MLTTRRFLSALLALLLALVACSVNLTETPTPAPELASATPAPGVTEATASPLPPTDVPPTAAAAGALTLDQLKNAEVQITGVAGGQNPQTVKLTDGKFEQGTDPGDANFMSISMGPQVAYGDLDGDGAQDAAIIIGENYGGTGVFVSAAAMLNQNGQPVFAGSSGIDDRPMVNSLTIQNGEILADVVVHGPNDPGCCPAQPETQTYRLWDKRLVLTGLTTKLPSGEERVITIESPASGTEVTGPFTVTGSVTVAPFENNLAYSVFLEGTADPVMQSSLLVNATEMGGPGTFQLPLDFSSAGIKGNLRIEISDLSAADGAYLALATLFVTAK